MIDEIIKLKGIHKTADVEERITGEVMKEMVAAAVAGRGNDDEAAAPPTTPAPVHVVSQFQIRKNFHSSTVWNTLLNKRISFSSSKRWIPKNPDPFLTSYPYGLCKARDDSAIND